MMSRCLSILLLGASLCGACASGPVIHRELIERKPLPVPPIDGRSVEQPLSPAASSRIQALNAKAGRPTFGLIRGYYQFPRSSAVGAAIIVDRSIFGSTFQAYIAEEQLPPFALIPASTQLGQALDDACGQLVNLGIRFANVSMADAVSVMNAEKEAIIRRRIVFPSRMLPSGVDVLLSLQRGRGELGPLFVGRAVRTSDGRLLALMSTPDAGFDSVDSFVFKLVGQALDNYSR